jgi:hypothetical protein
LDADEDVAGEEGDGGGLSAFADGGAVLGEEGLVALALEVGEGDGFLAGFGAYDVPAEALGHGLKGGEVLARPADDRQGTPCIRPCRLHDSTPAIETPASPHKDWMGCFVVLMTSLPVLLEKSEGNLAPPVSGPEAPGARPYDHDFSSALRHSFCPPQMNRMASHFLLNSV